MSNARTTSFESFFAIARDDEYGPLDFIFESSINGQAQNIIAEAWRGWYSNNDDLIKGMCNRALIIDLKKNETSQI